MWLFLLKKHFPHTKSICLRVGFSSISGILPVHLKMDLVNKKSIHPHINFSEKELMVYSYWIQTSMWVRRNFWGVTYEFLPWWRCVSCKKISLVLNFLWNSLRDVTLPNSCVIYGTFFVVVQLLSHVWLFPISWTVASQDPLFLGFPRQEYCSGLPFPSLGDLPGSRIEPNLLLGRLLLYHWAI